jgi:hypothetical protein
MERVYRAFPAWVHESFCFNPLPKEEAIPHGGLVFVDVFKITHVFRINESCTLAIVNGCMKGHMITDSYGDAMCTWESTECLIDPMAGAFWVTDTESIAFIDDEVPGWGGLILFGLVVEGR